MAEKRKPNLMFILCIVLTVFLVGMIVLSALLWVGKNNAEREADEYKESYEKMVDENKILSQEIGKNRISYKELAEAKKITEQELDEYKTSYESLLEANQKAEQEAKEEAEKAKQRATDYQNSYNMLVESMLNDAAYTETLGNLIIKVWHNAIWDTADEETDKFTKVNGEFVTDFNDALDALFSDAEFSKNLLSISANQKQIKEEMKEMLNPPEGYENAFKALENLYNTYITFSNIVLKCNGSLESFSNEFGAADDDMIQKYHAAELYIK